MRSNWSKLKFGELYESASGLSKSRDQFGFGHPFLSFKDVFHNYFLPEELTELVNTSEKERISCSIKKGDIFLTRTSETKDELGMSSVALKDYPEATFNGFTKRLRLKEEVDIDVDPLYMGYYLRSQEFRQSVYEHSSMTTRASLNNSAIYSIEVLLPPLDIQTNIGRCLKFLDDKRTYNRQINHNLESIGQTLFKSWFVDFDPVRAKMVAKEKGEDSQQAAMQAIAGKTAEQLQALSTQQREKLAATADLFPDALMETDQGEIPVGWEWKALYDTAEYVNGAAFKSIDFDPEKEGLPIVKIAELKAGITAQTKFTTKAMADKYAIDNEALLYSWSGSPDTSLQVFKWFGGKGWLNQHIFLINTESKAQKVYVFNLLKHLKPQLIEIAKNKQTTGLGHVTVADMKRIKVAYPDAKGICVIRGYLQLLFDLDSNNTLQNENLKQQRDALLPKLLSGEIKMV